MKNVKAFALLLSLSFCMLVSSAYANDGNDPETISNLRDKIVKLVDDPDLGEYGIQKAEVKLRFYVNGDQEIVVVDTGTENVHLDSFIKHRLNYQKIKDENLQSGMYNLKITFQSRN